MSTPTPYGQVPAAPRPPLAPPPPAPYGRSPQQPPAQPPARRGRTTTVVVTALVTAAVSVGATLLATGMFTGAPLFEQDALEDGVSTVLSDDFELTDVDDVACPATIVARGGEQFECTFTSGGKELSVPVEVLNDEGQYRVGGPLAEDEAPADEEAPAEEG